MPQRQYNNSVFINCPFDREYSPLFYAVVFAVFGCGYIARSALEQLQSIGKTIKPDEDSRTGFVSIILSNYGYITRDQTRSGRSPSGKSPGRIDLKIEDPIDSHPPLKQKLHPGLSLACAFFAWHVVQGSPSKTAGK
ncbi:MAG: hypothetical protein GY757_39535 [bacterium]|nr:hypothetical protein [bacterium]